MSVFRPHWCPSNVASNSVVNNLFMSLFRPRCWWPWLGNCHMKSDRSPSVAEWHSAPRSHGCSLGLCETTSCLGIPMMQTDTRRWSELAAWPRCGTFDCIISYQSWYPLLILYDCWYDYFSEISFLGWSVEEKEKIVEVLYLDMEDVNQSKSSVKRRREKRRESYSIHKERIGYINRKLTTLHKAILILYTYMLIVD